MCTPRSLAVSRSHAIAAALLLFWALTGTRESSGQDAGAIEGASAKKVLDVQQTGQNLLDADAWRPWQQGFQRQGDWFVCDNGDQTNIQRGASQTVTLNQAQPEPIVASAWSKAEGVTGSPDSDYSLYLDLTFTDGTPLWGQIGSFSAGTHDWQQRRVVVLPEKPVRQVAFHLLLRRHGGKAWFRDPELQVVRAPEGAAMFDGVPVAVCGPAGGGFQVRDVAAGSDFVRIDKEALGLKLEWSEASQGDATFVDATLSDATGQDRAITLVYAVPVKCQPLQWLHDPRQTVNVEPGREYVNAGGFPVGSSGRLSRYPLGAVSDTDRGTALGIDMDRPAFFRIGYNAAAEELFLAYDIGLAPEKPAARIRFCRFTFDRSWGFRAALAEAKRLAEENGDPRARALWTSGYYNEEGHFAARLLDTPWCNGAVWSMNSMPGIAGQVTDFNNKWNPDIRRKLYGPERSGDLDGEYVDSSEGYVTDVLDFRRDHFSAADTSLTFSPEDCRPAIFRGLVAFEYVRAIAKDVHGMGKLMMANGAPTRLCWLAPMLDVLGTETNWHPGGRWSPMSDAELLYRRAMSGPKPYCFLMNTRFEDFSHELVEKYMKRALAYGMFPGFSRTSDMPA